MTPPGPAPVEERPRHPVTAGLGHTLARNTLWTVGGRFVFLVAWALVAPYMLHALGPERFAIWALFFTLSGYFATFDLGLSQALVRFVAEFSVAGDRAALNGIVTLGVMLYALLGALAVAGLALFREPLLALVRTPEALRGEAGACLLGMAAVLALANLVGVMTAVLNGRQRMDLTNRITVLGTLIQIAGVLVVLPAGGGLGGLVASAALAQAFVAVATWFALRRVAPDVALEPGAMRWGLLRRVAGFSAALQVTNLGTLVQFQLDKLLLAHFITLVWVTPYELGYRLATAAWALPMLLLPPLVPAFAHLDALADRGRFLLLYRRASRYLSAVSFPVAGFTLVTAPALVTVWLGPGHADVVLALAGMTLFLLVIVHTGVATAALRGMGRPWLEARFHGVGMALHIGLSFALVPRHGLRGALAALVLSGCVATLYLLVVFSRRMGEPLGRWAARALAVPALASATAAVVALLWQRAAPVTLPAGRLAASLDLARAGLVFAGLVLGAYTLTGFLSAGEVRALLREGFARGAGPESEPR